MFAGDYSEKTFMPTNETTPRPPPGYWRAATIFCWVLMAIGIAAGMSMFEQFSAQVRDLQQKVQKTAQLQYVAVLLDDNGAPAMLATLQAGESAVQLQRLNAVAEGREDTMQLWALPETGSPRSLGIVQSGIKTPRVEFSGQVLTDATRIAISVESKGGVTQSQGPRLPYLFSGGWIRKAI
jgi:anti-sigma-K factor RskA